jgi:3',5'-cyclic-AMP phosphodiesterase
MMFLRTGKGKGRFLYCLVWVFIIGLVCGSAQSATLFERSQQKLESRLAGVQKGAYNFVVMGDSRDNDEVFKKCLLMAARYHPLFILHLGDAVPSGSEAHFQHFLALLEQTLPDMPVFVVAGNHELTSQDKGEKGKALFQQLIGPLDYVLDLPRIDARCIVLDNSSYLLTSKQIDYLKGQLLSDVMMKFVFLHIPPHTLKWIDSHTFSTGAEAFLQALEGRKPAGVFYGHYHLFDEDVISGTRHIITGGAGAPLSRLYFGDPSHHIVVVTLAGGQVATEKVLVPE